MKDASTGSGLNATAAALTDMLTLRHVRNTYGMAGKEKAELGESEREKKRDGALAKHRITSV